MAESVPPRLWHPTDGDQSVLDSAGCRRPKIRELDLRKTKPYHLGLRQFAPLEQGNSGRWEADDMTDSPVYRQTVLTS